MKKFIFLLVITLSLNSFTSLEKPAFNIVGKWRGNDKKEIGYIVFQEDGYAYFEDSKGNKMGGKDFVENGKKGNMTYKFDDSEALMKIDFIVKIVGEKHSNALLGIAQKIDNDSFKLCLSFENVRPKTFSKEETVVFTRVQ